MLGAVQGWELREQGWLRQAGETANVNDAKSQGP